MNQFPNTPEPVDEESKNSTIRVLAIIGSIAVIILGVWLAVKFVQVLPNAFSSLASMAENIYSGRTVDTLGVTEEKQVVNSGEAFTISWNDTARDGSYVFNYVCADGISVDVRANNEVTPAVSCVSGLVLPANVHSIEVVAKSEKKRFIDIEYSVAFVKNSEEEPSLTENRTVTIVNAGIPDTRLADEGGTTDETGTDQTGTGDVAEAMPKPSTGSGGTTAAPLPKPQTKTVIPQSDPNGYTDLRVSVLGTGTVNHGVFEPTSVVDSGERGIIVVEVRNIGTKTSDRWDFDMELPNGGDYSFDNESGLKPNERLVLTIEFDTDDLDGKEWFEGSVDVRHDINDENNDFEGTMRFNNDYDHGHNHGHDW